MKCAGKIDVRDVDESSINIDPIQAGGRLTPEAMKAVIAYGDGYSVCDQCRKPFRLHQIRTPPVDIFHRDLAAFVSARSAQFPRPTNVLLRMGARTIASAPVVIAVANTGEPPTSRPSRRPSSRRAPTS